MSSLSVGGKKRKQTKEKVWCKSKAAPLQWLRKGDQVFSPSSNDCWDSQVGVVVTLFPTFARESFGTFFFLIYLFLKSETSTAAVFLPVCAPDPHTFRLILISLGRLSPHVLLVGKDALPSYVRIVLGFFFFFDVMRRL